MNTSDSKTIVIVDDEKSYIDLLSQILAEHLSNPVVTFTRPMAALAALPQLNVGLIVTDYYMPQLNGLQFINHARILKPQTPFILITGHGVHLSAEELPQIPELKTILHKPFGWRTLAEEIVRCWSGADVPVIRTDVISN